MVVKAGGLDAVVFPYVWPDGRLSWCGQCVEQDIGSQGDTAQEAADRLDAVVEAERAYGRFDEIAPPPAWVAEMYQQMRAG